MTINIRTNFKAMSWEQLGYLKVVAECAPRGCVKNRWLLLLRIKLERIRRRKKGLIPDLDINDYSPDD